MDELTQRDFFFCYSKKVSDFLTLKGVKYITKAINPGNGDYYALYHKSDSFSKAMDMYDEYRRLSH